MGDGGGGGVPGDVGEKPGLMGPGENMAWPGDQLTVSCSGENDCIPISTAQPVPKFSGLLTSTSKGSHTVPRLQKPSNGQCLQGERCIQNRHGFKQPVSSSLSCV